MTQDLLGTERPRPRLPRFVVPVVVGVAVAGYAADQAWSRHEAGAMRTCVRTADSDLTDLTRRAAGVETYVGPQLNAPAVPSSVRASLAGLIEQSVARDLPRSRRDRQRCGGVLVLRWHGDTQRARDDYVRWLDQRLAQLGRATHDAAALHEPAADRSIATSSLQRAGIIP